jgi:NADH-quinone oxidoreductase subunit N
MHQQFLMETLMGLQAIGSELLLVVTLLGVVLADLFIEKTRSPRIAIIALLGTTMALGYTILQWVLTGNDTATYFHATITTDSFALFFKTLILSATVITILFSAWSGELWRTRSGEFYALLLTATAAANLLVSSTNLLMLFLALETLSLPSYILAGYNKGSRPAAEASLKYLLFGAASSGILLYGLSLLYGMSGSLYFIDIVQISQSNLPAFMLAMVLVLVGFGYKMSAVPFHFWAPDVYEGAPTPFVAYLSIASKAAGFAVFMRFLAPFFGVLTIAPFDTLRFETIMSNRFDLETIFWIVSILTMTLGNFVALRQTDFKRLLAYSSIAHAGYMLTGFVAANQTSFEAILFYFVVYLIMNLGVFLGVICVQNKTGSTAISAFQGVLYRSPAFAVAMAILIISLVGIPPTAGFVAKWKIFAALLEKARFSPLPAFYYSLALIAVLNAVVSAFYYLAIIRTMTFSPPTRETGGFRINVLERFGVITFAIPILLIQLYWTPISALAARGAGKMPPADIAIPEAPAPPLAVR